MNQTVKWLREQTANRLLDLRNLDYVVRTDSFESLLDRAVGSFRADILALCDGVSNIDPAVRSECLSALKEMLRIEGQRDVSIRDLREVARRLGVPKYSRLTKADLLSEIAMRKQNGRKQQSNCESDCSVILPSSGDTGVERDGEIIMRLQA